MCSLPVGLGNRVDDAVVGATPTEIAAHPLAHLVMGERDRFGREITRDEAGHATAHFRETGHPVARSIQPGDAWRYCYADEAMDDPEELELEGADLG